MRRNRLTFLVTLDAEGAEDRLAFCEKHGLPEPTVTEIKQAVENAVDGQIYCVAVEADPPLPGLESLLDGPRFTLWSDVVGGMGFTVESSVLDTPIGDDLSEDDWCEMSPAGRLRWLCDRLGKAALEYDKACEESEQ